MQSEFHSWKNDVCFGFLIAAMFAITAIGVIAGPLTLDANFAKTREIPVTLRNADKRAPQARYTVPLQVLAKLSGRQ